MFSHYLCILRLKSVDTADETFMVQQRGKQLQKRTMECRGHGEHVGNPGHKLHPSTSPTVLTWSCHWLNIVSDETVRSKCSTSHYFEQSHCASYQSSSIRSSSCQSPVATGTRWSGRCAYTSSHSDNPADRRLRLLGGSSRIGAAVELGKHLSDWAALFRTTLLTSLPWRRGYKMCPKHCLLHLILVGLKWRVGSYLWGRNK